MITRTTLRLALFFLFSIPAHAAETALTPVHTSTASACAARYADLWTRGAPLTIDRLNTDLKVLGNAHSVVAEEIAALHGGKKLTESQIHFLRKELKLPYLNDKELVGAKAMRGPFVGAYVNQLTTLQKVLEAEAARRKGAVMLVRYGLDADPFDVDTLAIILKNVPNPPPIADKAALQALLDAGRSYRNAENQQNAMPGYNEELKRAWRAGIRKKCCILGACANCPTVSGRFSRLNQERTKNGKVPEVDVLALLPDGDPGDLVLYNQQIISPEIRAEIGMETP
jgi:hypothetical protein